MPRRKQDRPKRMKWEDGCDGKEAVPATDDDEDDAMVAEESEAVSSPSERPMESEDSEHGEERTFSAESTRPDDFPLDFSLKKSASTEAVTPDEDEEEMEDEDAAPAKHDDAPLDLSVRRKETSGPRQAKHAKLDPHLPKPSSPWGYNAPKTSGHSLGKPETWNGKTKSCDTILNHKSRTRSGGTPPIGSPPEVPANIPLKSGGRQNPWQTQWMNKSCEQAKDVFTCVWCKDSFRSLAEMTLHMKQSPRCGMAGMQASVTSTGSTSPPAASTQHQASPSSASTPPKSALKESMPLPRKLVRGQDVWLGKGAEQTRQILKCMWCGQSFKTLADMTTHMRVTQHYTNIISQEQIISWRTPEDKVAAQSQVNAVLTCKVCDQAFGSLKELSYHMVKNSHYKEHILRSISEGGGRRRQTRERRKKSLPVRKLLELERMEISKTNPPKGDSSSASSGPRGEPADGKITCEECAEKVDAKDFVQHIKNCGQVSRSANQRIKTEPADPPDSPIPPPPPPPPPVEVKREPVEDSAKENSCDSAETTTTSSVLNAIERLIEKSFEYKGRRGQATSGILQRLGIDEEVYPPWHPVNSPGGGSKFGSKSSGSPLRNSYDHLEGKCYSDERTKSLFDGYAGSETSRGSTPVSGTIAMSPARSLTQSPHRTHSSLTGSTSESFPPSPHSPPAPRKSPEPVRLENGVCSGPTLQEEEEESRSACSPPAPPVNNHVQSRPCSVSSNDGQCHSPYSARPQSSESAEIKPPVSPKPEPQPVPKRAAKPKNSRKKKLSRAIKKLAKEESSEVTTSEMNADNPLKELQKLLDKTDAHLSRPAMPSGPGSILAFSWACNDVTTSDSLMKCAFCETHFISKGAYRHHLSKMHFVKEGPTAELPPTWKGAKNGAVPADTAAGSSKETSSGSSNSPSVEESPHSKFLKYTELAKQLSSKYV